MRREGGERLIVTGDRGCRVPPLPTTRRSPTCVEQGYDQETVDRVRSPSPTAKNGHLLTHLDWS